MYYEKKNMGKAEKYGGNKTVEETEKENIVCRFT